MQGKLELKIGDVTDDFLNVIGQDMCMHAKNIMTIHVAIQASTHTMCTWFNAMWVCTIVFFLKHVFLVFYNMI